MLTEAAQPNPHAAIDSLSFVSGYLYRIVRYAARDLGIRWTALMVLKDLSLLGPSTQRTLADVEQVTEPTMTVLLAELDSIAAALQPLMAILMTKVDVAKQELAR